MGYDALKAICQSRVEREFYQAGSRVIKQYRRGEITEQYAERKIERLRDRLRRQLETH